MNLNCFPVSKAFSCVCVCVYVKVRMFNMWHPFVLKNENDRDVLSRFTDLTPKFTPWWMKKKRKRRVSHCSRYLATSFLYLAHCYLVQ